MDFFVCFHNNKKGTKKCNAVFFNKHLKIKFYVILYIIPLFIIIILNNYKRKLHSNNFSLDLFTFFFLFLVH